VFLRAIVRIVRGCIKANPSDDTDAANIYDGGIWQDGCIDTTPRGT
jgi:hypothetical protein